MDNKGSQNSSSAATRLRILSRQAGAKPSNMSKSPPLKGNNEQQGSPKSFRIHQSKVIDAKGILDISSRKPSQQYSNLVLDSSSGSPSKIIPSEGKRPSGFHYINSLASSPRAGVTPINEYKDSARGNSPKLTSIPSTSNHIVTNAYVSTIKSPTKLVSPTNIHTYKEKLGRYLRSKPGQPQSNATLTKLDSSGFLSKKLSSPLANVSDVLYESNRGGGSPKSKDNKTYVGFADAHLNDNLNKDDFIHPPSNLLTQGLINRAKGSRGGIDKSQLGGDSSRQLRIEIKRRDNVITDTRDEKGHRVNLSQSPNTSHFVNLSSSPRPTLARLNKDNHNLTQKIKQDEEDVLARISKSPEPNNPELFKFREESTRPTVLLQTVKWNAPSWPRIEEEIRVDKLLGQGSFAKVYQGVDLNGKAIVAIKILDKRKIAELGFQKMVEKEIEIIQLVQNSHICRFERMLEDAKRVVSNPDLDLYCDGTLWINDIKSVLSNQSDKETI